MYALACALALAVGLASAPRPAAVNHSWEAFASSVNKGRPVAVTLMDLTRAEGKLVAIDERSLTIEKDHARRTIEFANIWAVRYAGVRSRRAKYGALIGAVVGAGGLWAADQKSDHPEPVDAAVMGAILFGLPGGAIVGASLPLGAPLYEAERARLPPPPP